MSATRDVVLLDRKQTFTARQPIAGYGAAAWAAINEVAGDIADKPVLDAALIASVQAVESFDRVRIIFRRRLHQGRDCGFKKPRRGPARLSHG